MRSNLIPSPFKGEVRVRVKFPLPLTPSREGMEDFFRHLPPRLLRHLLAMAIKGPVAMRGRHHPPS